MEGGSIGGGVRRRGRLPVVAVVGRRWGGGTVGLGSRWRV